ncbi:alpha/beta hydrolase [Sinosporangium siamense]|uniref:Peptidase n=1 Tax=Sinosporangium siamense TaxID=1367973 RepID=A0A919V643_9ACTN|nr:alpha/beta hydrolase [Sinosporangium siamense]GII91606.1 peptidase [Sinosporangium siamense]
MRNPRLTSLAAAVTLSALTLTATPASAGETSSLGTAPAISWGACSKLPSIPGVPAFWNTPECGTLTVPLDHGKPNGESLDVAVIRIKAKGTKQGSLVFNFGGPGDDGVDSLGSFGSMFGALGERYDLVSFAPRGIGRSSGVDCGNSKTIERFLGLRARLGVPAEREVALKATRAFIKGCEKNSGKILPHMGTDSAARDMDALRAALGEDKLDYLGFSYGTQLGAVYATLFPKNTGRMVLDAALDPTQSTRKMAINRLRASQKAYETFLADCVKRGCSLGRDAKAADRTVKRLVGKLDRKPLGVKGRKLTDGLAVTAVMAALYAEQMWKPLETALVKAGKGDGAELLQMADAFTGRRPDGSYNDLMTGAFGVACFDDPARPGLKQLIKEEAEFLKISPMFGGSTPLCSMWPHKGDGTGRAVNPVGAPPIVVIGGTGDPATPYEGSVSLAKKLKSGVLVTYKGNGHGAYLSGDKCVAGTVDSYLLDGKVPAAGTVCGSAKAGS